MGARPAAPFVIEAGAAEKGLMQKNMATDPTAVAAHRATAEKAATSGVAASEDQRRALKLLASRHCWLRPSLGTK